MALQAPAARPYLLGLALLTLPAAACGPENADAVSCDLRAAPAPLSRCDEIGNLRQADRPSEPYFKDCPGRRATARCPREGTLGGCQGFGLAGIYPLSWYYPDSASGVLSSDDVKRLCGGAVFVPAPGSG